MKHVVEDIILYRSFTFLNGKLVPPYRPLSGSYDPLGINDFRQFTVQDDEPCDNGPIDAENRAIWRRPKSLVLYRNSRKHRHWQVHEDESGVRHWRPDRTPTHRHLGNQPGLTGEGIYCDYTLRAALARMGYVRGMNQSHGHYRMYAKVRATGLVIEGEFMAIAEKVEILELYSPGNAAFRRSAAHKLGWPGKIQPIPQGVPSWATPARSVASAPSKLRTRRPRRIRSRSR